MTDGRIPLALTPAALDTVFVGLQMLHAQAGAALQDIQTQVQALQAPPLSPTQEKAPGDEAGAVLEESLVPAGDGH